MSYYYYIILLLLFTIYKRCTLHVLSNVPCFLEHLLFSTIVAMGKFLSIINADTNAVLHFTPNKDIPFNTNLGDVNLSALP